MSGGRRSAGLERDAYMVQVDEFGVGGQVQEFDGLRQQQHRRRGKQHCIGQRHDGADRAGISGLLIGILIGGGLLACLLDRRRGLRDKSMEVSE